MIKYFMTNRGIRFCQVCKGRKHQAELTLGHNLEVALDQDLGLIVVDYNCPDDISEYILSKYDYELKCGAISVFRVRNSDELLHLSKVKNLAMRIGAFLGGRYLVSLDIDNYVTENDLRSIVSLYHQNLGYWGFDGDCANGTCGRIGCPTELFFQLNGFREDFSPAGSHDVDFVRRMRKLISVVDVPAYKEPEYNTKEDTVKFTGLSVKEYNQAIFKRHRSGLLGSLDYHSKMTVFEGELFSDSFEGLISI